MFKEWKAIFKKPTFIIVMIGVALIPALYNVIFLSSMWDPYGKLSDLPVAVVNQDQAASYQGEKMTIGKDMVSNFEKNDALDFHIVEEKEAKEGLEKGDYYMVITLPKDLSKKAASILTNHPEQLTIDYQTSSGHSFIAGKMSDTAMTKIQQTVADNVTRTYTSALFEKMGSLKTGMGTAVEGSQKLANGAQQLKNGSQTLTDHLTTLSHSSLTFSNGARTLSTGLLTYTNGVGQVGDGLHQMAEKVPTLVSGVSQLNDGFTTFHSGLTAYTSGVGELGSGLNQMASQTPQLASGVGQLTAGMGTLNDGFRNYTNGVGQLNSGLSNLSSGLVSYTNGVASLSEGAGQLSSQSETLRNGVSQLESGIQTLSSQLQASTSQSAQIDQLTAGLNQLNAAIQNASVDTSQLSSGLSSIASSAQSILTSAQADRANTLTSVQGTTAYQAMTADQQAEISAAISSSPSSSETAAQAILTTIQTIQGSLNRGNSLTQLQTAANQVLPTASTALTDLSSGLSNIQSAVTGQLLPASQTINQGIGAYTDGVDKIASGATQLQANSSNLTTGARQLAVGVGQLDSKSSELLAGSNQLASGLGELNGKMPVLTLGMNQLVSGATQLTDKSGELVAGAGKLADGVGQLNSKTPELAGGVNQLVTGVNQLTEKSGQLVAGADKLADGANQISDGSSKLATGGQTLTTALGELARGSQNLSQGLADAKEQLKVATTEKENAKVLSSPVTLTKTDHDHVPVNGVGMAPYMISVALFVAALSTNMIFAKLPSGRHPESRWAWLKARIEVNGIVAISAGILVYGAVHMIGLSANYEGLTLFLCVLASVTFMSVVTALTTWNNKIGAFFSLILLLLQLASSAGTYPLALTNRFFQVIHPLLPMSYTVSGLRETISLTGAIGGQVAFLLTVLAACTGLGMLAYRPQKYEDD